MAVKRDIEDANARVLAVNANRESDHQDALQAAEAARASHERQLDADRMAHRQAMHKRDKFMDLADLFNQEARARWPNTPAEAEIEEVAQNHKPGASPAEPSHELQFFPRPRVCAGGHLRSLQSIRPSSSGPAGPGSARQAGTRLIRANPAGLPVDQSTRLQFELAMTQGLVAPTPAQITSGASQPAPPPSSLSATTALATAELATAASAGTQPTAHTADVMPPVETAAPAMFPRHHPMHQRYRCQR